jgi:hypothetical protein
MSDEDKLKKLNSAIEIIEGILQDPVAFTIYHQTVRSIEGRPATIYQVVVSLHDQRTALIKARQRVFNELKKKLDSQD